MEQLDYNKLTDTQKSFVNSYARINERLTLRYRNK